MVVRSSVHLYLENNLYCPISVGMRVEFPQPEGGPVPVVTVDLRGHTLWGPGTSSSIGLTAFTYPDGPSTLQVTNGRIENWGIGVGGDNDSTVTHVKLVNNEHGYVCGGYCLADTVYVRSSTVGLYVDAESSPVVKHSTFSHNKTGIAVIGSPVVAHIERNTFTRNRTGIFISCNSTGELVKNTFDRNYVDIDRQSCD